MYSVYRNRLFNCIYFQNGVKLKNIDHACRSVVPDLKHFVCMQSDANEVCESRNNVKASCVNVQCDKSIRKPEIILKYMKKMIESIDDSKLVSVVVSDSSISEHGYFIIYTSLFRVFNFYHIK